MDLERPTGVLGIIDPVFYNVLPNSIPFSDSGYFILI